jgi:hypothetical protein
MFDHRPLFTLFMLSIALAAGSALSARNVDLSTVPNRDTVQLTIYNSEDLTLVRETRKVSFKPGVNALQFSWANTLIDPSSVELRFLDQSDKLELLDTTFPHDKPQMLYWNVQSEIDGPSTIEITYFTSGISWSADYECIADAQEKNMHLEGFVRVSNHSGEEYENAQVRLVVGTINLVEKIAQLARIPMREVVNLERDKREELRMKVAKDAMLCNGPAGKPLSAEQSAPKEIIKEGLSEYFIYTIEGTETIVNGWSKRMRSLEATDVPFKIQYRYRKPEYGPQLVRMYLLKNDQPSKLGTTPLPDGVVRLFRDNGRRGLSFLVAQSVKYIPIGDKIELNLGPDPDVVFELLKIKVWRDNLWMQIHGTSTFRRADQPGEQIETNSSLAGWDDHTLYVQRVRNYTARPIDVEIRRSLDGHVIFRSGLKVKNYDYRTVEYAARVEAGKTADLPYEIVQHQSHNAKQNNVTLEEATLEP